MLREKGVVYVYKIGPNVVGTAKLIVETKLHDSVARIEDLVVDKGSREKGVGSSMVSELIDIAKTEGCYKITVVAKKGAEGFYNKVGLTETGTEFSSLL